MRSVEGRSGCEAAHGGCGSVSTRLRLSFSEHPPRPSLGEHPPPASLREHPLNIPSATRLVPFRAAVG
ncbi:hypothetical protein GCM10010300_78350 [Streptomyces olivaceoviridis]|nr:hypothetical protein GCM10010300_78350 [Streptomyces olivaceoviridis]